MRRLIAALTLFAFVLSPACSSSAADDASTPTGAATAAGPGKTGYVSAVGARLQDTVGGGETRTIVKFDDGSALMDPALSPDGRKIAFIRQEPAKNLSGSQIDFGADLYIVNRDGSGLRELAHHSALAEYVRGPSWLDNGHLLFSVRGRTATGTADYRLERIDVATGQRTRLTQNAVDPSVASDGRQMLYISVETATTRETLVLSDVDGGNARDLLPPTPVLTLLGSAVMSPDGTQVAFAAGDLAGALGSRSPRSMAAEHPFFQDVWLINADGTNLRRIAEVVEKSLSLSWSPDGKSIYAMGTEKFRRIDLATGTIAVLSEGAPQAGVFVYEQR